MQRQPQPQRVGVLGIGEVLTATLFSRYWGRWPPLQKVKNDRWDVSEWKVCKSLWYILYSTVYTRQISSQKFFSLSNKSRGRGWLKRLNAVSWTDTLQNELHLLLKRTILLKNVIRSAPTILLGEGFFFCPID